MNNHIQALTGLRGVAALIVFVSHGANQQVLPKVLGNGFGQIGVMLFFVLSGFLMAYLYLHKDPTANQIRSFVLARIGRVFPLYVALILASFFLIATGLKTDFHYRVEGAVVLTEALLFLRAPNEFWTIPVEVQFYCLFLMVWWVSRRTPQRELSALFIFWGLSTVPSIVYWIVKEGVLPLVTTYATPFFLGVLFAKLLHRVRSSQWHQRSADRLGLIFFVAVLVNLPSLRLEYGIVLGDGFYLRTWLDPLNWMLVLGLFYCAMLNGSSLRFLGGKLTSYFGNISYALYLFHYPVLIAVTETELPNALKFPTALCIVIFLAHVSGRYFEVPAAAAIRKLGASKARVSSD
ncbi:MAG: acyltransferase [Pseudomonadota bacterium]